MKIRLRRRVKIKALEVISKRRSIFTKRRDGLFKKTKMYCEMADAKAGVVVFSKAGKAFGFGHAAVEEVIDRYHPSASSEIEADGGGVVEMEEAADLPLTEMERRLRAALATDQPAWDEVMKGLGLRDLDELEMAVVKIQSLASERRREMAAQVRDPGS